MLLKSLLGNIWLVRSFTWAGSPAYSLYARALSTSTSLLVTVSLSVGLRVCLQVQQQLRAQISHCDLCWQPLLLSLSLSLLLLLLRLLPFFRPVHFFISAHSDVDVNVSAAVWSFSACCLFCSSCKRRVCSFGLVVVAHSYFHFSCKYLWNFHIENKNANRTFACCLANWENSKNENWIVNSWQETCVSNTKFPLPN